MLSRLILLLLQLVIAWIAAPPSCATSRVRPVLQLFVYAAVFAVLVWLVGLVLAQVLRETGTPSSATLVAALVVALIAAALVTWLPVFVPDLPRACGRSQTLAYPLIGALIGYHIRR